MNTKNHKCPYFKTVISVFLAFIISFFISAVGQEKGDQPGEVSGLKTEPIRLFLNISPGEKVKRSIKIENNTGQSVKLDINKIDFDITSKGGFLGRDPGSQDRSAASWFTVPSKQKEISKDETISIPLQISRPKTSEKGAFWAGITLTNSQTVDQVESEGATFGVKYRVVIPVYILDPSIKGAGNIKSMKASITEPEEEKTNPFEDEKEGSNENNDEKQKYLSIKFTFENDCKNILTNDVNIQIRNKKGEVVKSVKKKDRVVLPSHKKEFNWKFPANKLKPGDYIAVATVDYGESKKIGAQYLFSVPKSVSEK